MISNSFITSHNTDHLIESSSANLITAQETQVMTNASAMKFKLAKLKSASLWRMMRNEHPTHNLGSRCNDAHPSTRNRVPPGLALMPTDTVVTKTELDFSYWFLKDSIHQCFSQHFLIKGRGY